MLFRSAGNLGSALAQQPQRIDMGGVSRTLARDRAVNVSDLRYDLAFEVKSGESAVTGEAERHAVTADAVARAVEHALTAKRPRPHYLVGRDARLRAALAAMLPQGALDSLHRWVLKVPRRR